MNADTQDVKKTPDNLMNNLDKVINNRELKSEEEFLYTIDFWSFILMSLLMQDSKSQQSIDPNNFNSEAMEIISNLVRSACRKYDLKFPGSEESEGKKGFHVWITEIARKYNQEEYLYFSSVIFTHIAKKEKEKEK